MRRKLSNKRRGQTLVEYALLVAFTALVVVVFLRFLGGNVTNFFDRTSATLSTV